MALLPSLGRYATRSFHKSLIADGVDPNGERTLLQELRDAGFFLAPVQKRHCEYGCMGTLDGRQRIGLAAHGGKLGKHNDDDDM